jgi:hypothetical protein
MVGQVVPGCIVTENEDIGALPMTAVTSPVWSTVLFGSPEILT